MDDSRTGPGDRDAPMPARMLNEYVYCPRLFHLMHVQRVFVESAETVEGTGQHARARKASRGGGLDAEPPWGHDAREVSFTSSDGRLTGKFDVVARDEDGSAVPVEAKHGAAPEDRTSFDVLGVELPGTAWPNDLIQLGVQARLLRDGGEACHEGRLFYRRSQSTVRVKLDASIDEAVERVLGAVEATLKGPMPAPLVDSPKCLGCSLSSVCLPDETNYLLHRQRDEPRRVIAARADGGGLYVVSQGGRVGKTSQSLTVATRDGVGEEVPVKDCEHVAVFGQVQVSSQALSLLLDENRCVFWHTRSGRLIGRAVPPGAPNLALRRRQFRAADEPATCLAIGRGVLQSKIQNQRVLLRRNAEEDAQRTEALRALDEAARGAASAESLDAAIGHEGRAARLYFDALELLFGADEGGPLLSGRTRRPPKDPVNAALSFGYALLVSDAVAALTRVGLDPDLGFLHQPVPGRPALALDLMEPFRPLIVDSVVLRAFRTQQLQRKDFAHIGPAWRMHDHARRELIGAYERRMDELVTHPKFGYRMTYRRILEVEARLLGRHLEGELPAWEPLVTR